MKNANCVCCKKTVLIGPREHNKNIFCQDHMKRICCMKDECDLYNRRNHCNTVTAPIKRIENGITKYYCKSHWKKRISKCKHCNSDSILIDKDGWGYCKKHKLNHNIYKNEVCNVLSNFLPEHISECIYVKS